MKVVSLKRETRFDAINDIALGIQKWGNRNDYPQSVGEIVNASSTGKPCLSTYAKFINGKGFKDTKLSELIINSKKQTANYILNLVSKDLAKIGGVALHFNYNLLGKIVEIQEIPIEFVRFEKLDSTTYQFNRVAIHQDWGMRNTKLKRFTKEDIIFINLYNPETVLDEIEACGGIENYNGQVLFYSNQGNKTYPLPIYDNIVTEMSTEEGVSNVSYRNARNNFLPSGMFVEINNPINSIGYKQDEEEKDYKEETQLSSVGQNLLEMQGDENACKILYCQVDSKEDAPIFTPFEAQDFDKRFTVTTEQTRNKIGGAFVQPPILRAENVANGLGAETMRNAYDFYNSITSNERAELERIFKTAFDNWHEPINVEFTINPLSYDVELTLAQKVGEQAMAKIIEVVCNTQINAKTKKQLLKTLFSLTDTEINELVWEQL